MGLEKVAAVQREYLITKSISMRVSHHNDVTKFERSLSFQCKASLSGAQSAEPSLRCLRRKAKLMPARCNVHTFCILKERVTSQLVKRCLLTEQL